MSTLRNYTVEEKRVEHEVEKTREAEKTNLSVFWVVVAVIVAVIALVMAIVSYGNTTTPERGVAKVIRNSVEPYLVKQTDEEIRTNNYFVRTLDVVDAPPSVFDLSLYLKDWGASNVRYGTVHEEEQKAVWTVCKFNLGGSEFSILSHYCYVELERERVFYQLSSDLLVTTGTVTLNTMNTELSPANNYRVYEKTEAFTMDRATLGQLCYIIQNGYYNSAKLDDAATKNLAAMNIFKN